MIVGNEVTPLTDDQEENEGERGRTALKLASQNESFFGFLPRIQPSALFSFQFAQAVRGQNEYFY